ncbi:MAG: LA2681 family HEPN domain-containing protein [Geothrix sp.]|nr:LA2681 family HEPN domain-containing protein [Geothrix sp.]
MAGSKPSVKELANKVDEAWFSRDMSKLQECIDLIKDQLQEDGDAKRNGALYYFLANAHSGKRACQPGKNTLENWEDEDIEAEIFNLRVAHKLLEGSRSQTGKVRYCQASTNLGNALSLVGRPVEAIYYWDKALEALPFGMAMANRGYGLLHYSRFVPDPSHKNLIAHRAYRDMATALEHPIDLEPGSTDIFADAMAFIRSNLGDFVDKDFDLNTYSLGKTHGERQYRRWCLNQRLFLNPLNDLGSLAVAAADVLHLPTITTDLHEGPWALSFFNQLKQEYVSARFLLYEGIHNRGLHYSDKDVSIVNTLDYSSHTIHTQKIIIAFRAAYSLFDKVAYFVNEYIKVGIPIKFVSIKTIWYTQREKKKGINPLFTDLENNALRGLYWLSKDLSENRPGFRDAMEPEAQEIDYLRQCSEHRFLKLVDFSFRSEGRPQFESFLGDKLSNIQTKKEFVAKAIKLMQLSRSALLYLSLAVQTHEVRKKRLARSNHLTAPINLGHVDDKWKV